MRAGAIQPSVWVGRIHDSLEGGGGVVVDLVLVLAFTEGGFASAFTTGCFGVVAREW